MTNSGCEERGMGCKQKRGAKGLKRLMFFFFGGGGGFENGGRYSWGI